MVLLKLTMLQAMHSVKFSGNPSHYRTFRERTTWQPRRWNVEWRSKAGISAKVCYHRIVVMSFCSVSTRGTLPKPPYHDVILGLSIVLLITSSSHTLLIKLTLTSCCTLWLDTQNSFLMMSSSHHFYLAHRGNCALQKRETRLDSLS